MLNFTVGPVMMDEETMRLGAEPVPYFRTDEFSDVMLESERFLCKFAGTGKKGRVAFLTGSGTYDGEDFSRVIFVLSKNQCLCVEMESRSVVEAQRYDVDVTVFRMVEICYGLMV